MSSARNRTKKKLSPAICRCCLCNLPDGFIKDISAPYIHDGQQEVYADMLKDTFDIEISFQEGCGPSRHSRLICDDCIVKLRDASLFKQKVLDNEENILQYLASLKNGAITNRDPVTTQTDANTSSHQNKQLDITNTEVKNTEATREESENDDDNDNTESDVLVEDIDVLADIVEQEHEVLSDDEPFHFEEVEAIEIEALDDEFLENVKVEVDSDDEDTPLGTQARKRAALQAAASRAKRVKVEQQIDDEDVVIAKDKIVPDYTLILLENSNMCPFEYNQGSNIDRLLKTYKCFLCALLYNDMKELREHFAGNHDINELVTKVLQSKLDDPINADISNLQCKLCSEGINNMKELTEHLSDMHNLEFGNDSVHNLMPYKLVGGTFRCQFCEFRAQEFFSLYKHSSRHRRQCGKTKVICELCGKSFSSYDPESQLDKHMHSVHGQKKKTTIRALGSREKIGNALKMIRHSNMCPMTWPKEKEKKYKCFCCPFHFTELQQLREHFETEHDRTQLNFSGMDMIKVDVTDLQCADCHHPCVDLLGLKSHLISEHNIAFDEVDDIIFPLLLKEGYKCIICNEDFKRWFYLNKHIRSDHFPMENQQLICGDCGMEFPSKKTIKYHINKVHSESKALVHRSRATRDNTIALVQNSNMWLFKFERLLYKCFVCDFKTLSVEVLKDHCLEIECRDVTKLEDALKANVPYRTNHVKAEITDLMCRKCNETFDDIQTFQIHLIDIHEVYFHSHVEHYLMPYHIMGGLKCGFCKQPFTVMQTMTRHVTQHASKEVCDMCGSLFLDTISLQSHLKKKHGPIKCKICHVGFQSYAERREHNKQNHKNMRPKRRFQCLFCVEVFTHSEAKMRHMTVEHDYNSPQHKCDICNRIFYTRGAFANHTNVHAKTTTRRIHCRYCDFICYVKLTLAEHMQTYHKDESAGNHYKCDFCDKLFISVELLRHHLVDHCKSGEGLECVYCDQEFKARKSLYRHLVKKHDVVEKEDNES